MSVAFHESEFLSVLESCLLWPFLNSPRKDQSLDFSVRFGVVGFRGGGRKSHNEF